MKTVHIEFFSDFICPWCYIGKARLERVQDLLAKDIQLDIDLAPYVLYPHVPPGGLPKEQFARRTKPGMGRSLKQEAQVEGIVINYKNIERIPYSLEAHRLVFLVKDKKIKYELAKKIFHGYFEEGRDIEDHDFLIAQAKAAGVPQAVIGEFFSTNIGEKEIHKSIQTSKEAFISIVPSLRIDRKIVLPGLHPAEVWENYIRRAAQIQ